MSNKFKKKAKRWQEIRQQKKALNKEENDIKGDLYLYLHNNRSESVALGDVRVFKKPTSAGIKSTAHGQSDSYVKGKLLELALDNDLSHLVKFSINAEAVRDNKENPRVQELLKLCSAEVVQRYSVDME